MPIVNKEPIAILPGSDSEFELDIRVSTIRIETTPTIQNGYHTQTCGCTYTCTATCATCICSVSNPHRCCP